MGNTLLTPAIIAREALMALENNAVLSLLVHRDYSDEFAKVGDTITIRKPATFTAKEFDGSIEVQDAVEGSTTVALDTHLDVSFALGPQELTLDIVDFSAQFVQPAMRALAQKIDAMLAGLYAGVPYTAGAAGTTPSTLADLVAPRKVLNLHGVPLDSRSLVIDPAAEAKFLTVDAIVNAEKAGTTDALRNASLGRLMGFGVFMDQNVATHTCGTLDAAATATAAAGATTLTIAAGGNAKTLAVGDIVTINGVSGSYVVTEQMTTLADGSGSAKIYPALAGACTGATVAVLGSHTANLAFHKNAFALVTRPLAPPLGAAAVETLSWNGISVRVVYSYNSTTKVDTVSLDLLCGVKCLFPELACRVLG